MSLLNLPNELLLHTATFLNKESDILSLIRLNRHTYHLFINYLYDYNVKHHESHGVAGATISGQLPAVERFIAHNFDVFVDPFEVECRRKRAYGQSGNIMWHACKYNAPIAVILRLIEAGVDPNDNVLPRNWDRQLRVGNSPVVYAICNGNTPLVRLLLSHGASFHQRLYLGRGIGKAWPLHVASFAGPAELVQLLLEHGADPMAIDHFERTPLIYAVGIPAYVWYDDPTAPDGRRRSQEVWYESCIEWDESGQMPHALAAEPQEREKIIKPLLDYGADPEAQISDGLTSLVAPYFKIDPITGKAEYMLQNTDRMKQYMLPVQHWASYVLEGYWGTSAI